jgi:transmembrane sensor
MTGDPARRSSDGAIEQIALDFFARGRSSDVSAEETAVIADWLARDPRHRAAYEGVSRLWSELGELRQDSTILQMREDAVGAIARRRHRKYRRAALAASLVAGIVVAGTASLGFLRSTPVQQAVRAQTFATDVGQISRVDLPDGSTAVLDTDSAMRSTIGGRGERRIELLRGRIQFAVAKIPERPFSVSVNGTQVTALGTHFDVYRRGGGVEVNLVEGRLRVTQRPSEGSRPGGQGPHSLDMAAGDRLIVDPTAWHLTRGIATGEGDWVKGQLVFENAPIGTVIAELNRYTNRKLVLTDPTLAARPISAIVRTDNPTMFLDALRAMNIGSVVQQSTPQ